MINYNIKSIKHKIIYKKMYKGKIKLKEFKIMK